MPKMHRLTWLRTRLTSLGVVSLFPSISHPSRHCTCFPSRLSTSRFLSRSPTSHFLEEYGRRYVENAHKAGSKNSKAPPSYICESDYNRFYKHIRTTPLLDLLSVSVQNSSNDECEKEQKRFEIYGNIQLIDVEQNHAYDVFRRTCKNPLTVLSGCDLLLKDPKGICTYLHVPSASAFKMRMHLKDAATNGKVIAKGDFDLQLFDHKDGLHERVITEVVRGRKGYFASVQYATLPHAVLATVWLVFTKIDAAGSDQSQPSHAHIYGCISATSKVRQGDNISSVLLNMTPSDPMMVMVGKPIQLTRPMLAVPAYSSLEIKADLWDHHTNQQIASGVILTNCEAQDEDWILAKCVLGQIYHVRVEVRWDNAFVPQIAPDQQSSSALSYRGSLLAKDELMISSPKPSLTGSPMVEVFSVSISPDSDVNFCFCGTIEVYDNKNSGGHGNPFVMFERIKSDAVMLSSDMQINLRWPTCPIEGESFYMRLKLSDDRDHEVCSGFIDWSCISVVSPISWFGKLISSVIRGKHGYATVRYAMFPNAVHADVYAKFRPDNSCGYVYMVIGNVTAWYSCFTYSSDTEKKFFQSKLLTHDHKSIVFTGGSLKFDKNTVAVPVDSSLILGLNLQVGVMGKTTEGPWFSKHFGSLNQVVDFNFDVGNDVSSKMVAGEGFCIEVIVHWKEIDESEKWEHFRTLESDLLSRLQVV